MRVVASKGSLSSMGDSCWYEISSYTDQQLGKPKRGTENPSVPILHHAETGVFCLQNVV